MRTTFARAAAAVGALTLGLTAAALAQAQPPAGHTHTSPHGGDIVEVAEHHVEFKADSSGAISVWLLDGRERTIAPPAGATVTLQKAAGTQVTLPLQLDASAQRLTARFDPRQFASFQAIVSLTVAGSRRNLRFRYPSHH